MWGLGIGLGAVAAAIIFYVLTSDQGAKFFPNIQQKLVGALHLSDTNSTCRIALMAMVGCVSAEECERVSLKI